jgi:uncharacterized protein
MNNAFHTMTSLIVRCCDPDEVVLFGSHAKGTARSDSDIDLLVIGPFAQSRYLRARELKELLYHVPMGVDLHLYTPAEIANELANPLSFIVTVRWNCVVLYRRPGIAPCICDRVVWSG